MGPPDGLPVGCLEGCLVGCPVGVGAPTHTCANQPKELIKIKIKPSLTISSI